MLIGLAAVSGDAGVLGAILLFAALGLLGARGAA